MKKVLIIGLILGIGFYAYSKTKTEELPNQSDGIPTETEEDVIAGEDNSNILSRYENRIIADKDGFYMLVKNNKLFNPIDEDSIKAWQQANPTVADVLQVSESIWKIFSNSNYGGKF